MQALTAEQEMDVNMSSQPSLRKATPNSALNIIYEENALLRDDSIDCVFMDAESIRIAPLKSQIEYELLPVAFSNHLISEGVSAVTSGGILRGRSQSFLCLLKPEGSDSIIEACSVQLHKPLSRYLFCIAEFSSQC